MTKTANARAHLGLILAIVFATSACSNNNASSEGGDSEGDTTEVNGGSTDTPTNSITPVQIQGSIAEPVLASNNIVGVKSSDGLLTELMIDSTNHYNATALSGSGPWVLRVQTSTNRNVYGIAYGDDIRNINRFSDLSLRSWFAKKSLDLDAEYDSTEPFTDLPDANEYAESASNVFQLIAPVLNSYGVSGEEIISTDYLVNDQVVNDEGIDTFLKRNSVLIEKSKVKFLITDPVTNTQSITASQLTLQAEFRDTGTVTPTPPGAVKAIGSSPDKIVLVWEPSVDDVAVIEYQVIRDGALITSTPYPVYVDSGLVTEQPYSYAIIAIDGAGNQSDAASSKIATALQINDTTAPPPPVLLVENMTTASAIHFSWVQPLADDIVSYNVYRDISGQPFAIPLLQVTGTEATDVSVVENETYCYRVEAVDASGNQSALSEILCISAKIDTGSTNSSNGPLFDWKIPDIDTLTCDQFISAEQVRQGLTVIPEGCYLVPETLSVGPGATLRLSAGAVLKFGSEAKLLVPAEATLTAIGTAENPVVLTGELSVMGHWGGVEFRGSASVGNMLRGTVIQFAGGGDSLAALSATQSDTRFQIEDSLVQFNQKQAIDFGFNNTTIDSFRGNRLTDNESIGAVNVDLLESLAGNSELTGNTNDVMSVPRNRFSNTHITIPDLGIPLSWNGINLTNGTLSIEAGAQFEMVSNSVVEVDGVFSAIGTAQQPIVMNGRSNTTRPNWAGMRLSGAGSKTFNHVKLKDAGSASQNTGAIDVTCTVADAAKLSIFNTEIANSASWGIFVTGTGCDTQIGENVTYINNASGDFKLP